MNFIDNITANESLRYLLISLSFIVLFIVLAGIYNFIIKRWRIRTHKSKSKIDDFIVRLFRVPGTWAIFAVMLNIFSSYLKEDENIFSLLQKISNILLILIVGWLIVQFVRAMFHHWQKKLDINNANNLEARKKLTQVSMLERIVIISITFIFVSIALMSIESIRELGVSLLASAGVAGIIIGFAAQRSFGQVFSGIQIAFTQPIRIDDVVVIEGEWGRIEEINITYAVVKIWDQRRLIVPIDYFLNNPIQNWTRTESEILGTALLLMYFYDFIDAGDDRFVKTVKYIRENLFHEGLMYRYKAEDDFGVPTSSFTICTFWLIDALYMIGEKEEARELFENMISYSNHLGLYSEDLDFDTKRQLGNFPQAYSHLAFINTAALFSEEKKLSKFIRP
jgi:small-conductance mechanosensitive channel